MLSADQVKNPNALNLQGDHVRRVIKRGFSTNPTICTLTRFMSFGRKYLLTGTMESLEVPILSHEQQDYGVFSMGGDSGSIIVSTAGELVALLTGGSCSTTDCSDITYSTLLEWIWELVKEEFPGAYLYFDEERLE